MDVIVVRVTEIYTVYSTHSVTVHCMSKKRWCILLQVRLTKKRKMVYKIHYN